MTTPNDQIPKASLIEEDNSKELAKVLPVDEDTLKELEKFRREYGEDLFHLVCKAIMAVQASFDTDQRLKSHFGESYKVDLESFNSIINEVLRVAMLRQMMDCFDDDLTEEDKMALTEYSFNMRTPSTSGPAGTVRSKTKTKKV